VTRARLVLVLALLAAFTGTTGPAQALTSFTDVEDEVMCDTCNVPLNIAESARADQLRKEIRIRIARGESKQQIKDELRTTYGDKILALPPKSGFSLAAYLVPILVAAALIALIAVLVPRWRRRGGSDDDGSPGPDLAPGDARRLDAELASFDA
jgi:cytochrome c-type biogenesis protein CcmH/NrfF